ASRMPRSLKIGLVILGIGFAITLGLFVDVVGRIQSMVQEKEPEGNPFTPPPVALYDRTDPPMTVKLFFPGTQEDVILSAEDHTIFRSAVLANRARQILQKVLDGPTTQGLYPSVPKDTKLQEVFIDDTGMAYVDFSSTIAANHPGGMLSEQATVYSVVNSLTYNLPEIRQVKILVGGAEKETLAGHFLLLPLGMDLSITDVPPPKEPVNNG
ncbi:MAG TPA: GerMN domain-containing protein, partial [Terriglobia bacterium]|nr:GerMN domain-containing protein [Terriglobia bacterium]